MAAGATHVSAKSEKAFYVYLHCKPDGTPFYVGKGSGNRSHSFGRRNPYHKNVVAKYGKENIEVLVFPQVCEQTAFDVEIKWKRVLCIAGYALANMTDGGEGTSGYRHPPVSDERRKQLGDAARGKKQTPETIAKKRAALIGKRRTDEQRARMSAGMKGVKHKPLSEEHRQKVSLIHIGNKHRLGHKASEETKTKQSKSGKAARINSEVREKMAERMMGNKNAVGSKSRTGCVTSEEVRAKIAVTLIGRKLSAECKAKIAIAGKGRKASTQAIENMQLGWVNRKAKAIAKFYNQEIL